MSDAQFLTFDDLEVTFRRINDLNGGGANLIFELHHDDTTDDLFNAFRHRKGCRFKIAGVQIPDDESNPQPAQEEPSGESYDGTKPPAAPNRSPGALSGYALEAVRYCDDLEFADFLSNDFQDSWGTTKAAVLDLIDVKSRKEIIRGTPAGDRWELLILRFQTYKKWKKDRNSASAQS